MSFKYEKDSNNIVTVTMDMDGPVNSMNKEFGPLFTTMVNKLEAETGLKGVILTSGKETFFAGADLKRLVAVELDQLQTARAEVDAYRAGHRWGGSLAGGASATRVGGTRRRVRRRREEQGSEGAGGAPL